MICLACAHHGKFPAAINAALGDDAKSVPPESALTDLLSVPHRKDILENSARAVIDFVEKTMASASRRRRRRGRRAAAGACGWPRVPWAFLGSKVDSPRRSDGEWDFRRRVREHSHHAIGAPPGADCDQRGGAESPDSEKRRRACR